MKGSLAAGLPPEIFGSLASYVLAAGLVPGVLPGWPWPDRFRHALALAAAADLSGSIGIASDEHFMADVVVECG